MILEKEKENVFSKLKNIYTAYSIGTIYIILIILTLFLLFNSALFKSNSNTQDKSSIELTFFVIITFVLISLALCVLLLPNFKNIDILLKQIKSTFYFVLYTIFLILFFRLFPKPTLNEYATIIVPLSLFFTAFLFYKAFKTNYIMEFSTNYEKIKIILLFFSLITILFLYYSVDPGGLIKKNLGNSLLFTVLLSLFSFIYLIVVLSIDSNASNMNGGNTNSNTSNFIVAFFKKIMDFFNFSQYNWFIWIINTLFLFFIVYLIIGIVKFPDGFLSNMGVSTAVIIFTFIILLIWASIILVTYAPNITNKIMDLTQIKLFNKSILLLLSTIVLGLIIGWFIYSIKIYSGGESTFLSLAINILIILLVLTFIYKIMNVSLPEKNSKNSQIYDFFDIIKKIIFYIPCLISEFFDIIIGFISNEYNNTSKNNFYFLIFTILLIVSYYLFFYLKNMFLLQGGKLLVNEPINTSALHPVASYQELNGQKETRTIRADFEKVEISNDLEEFNYQYGLSFWFYINSVPANTLQSSHNKYISLLNYGNKPNILYNFQKNTLIVVMQKGKLDNLNTTSETSNIDELIYDDSSSSLIVYKKENVLLQKWNNLVLNVSSGTLDIFINSELVKSVNGIVPYMTLDQLAIGSTNGIQGGICNLIYFKRPLTSSNIYYLYNSVKDKKIPIF